MRTIEIEIDEHEGGEVAVFVRQQATGGTDREKRVEKSVVAAALSASLPPPPEGYARDESELERALRVAGQTTD